MVAVQKNHVIQVASTKYKDTGGGFLLEERPTRSEQEEIDDILKQIEHESEELPIDFKDCIECDSSFATSYLWATFNYPVCDVCRDPDDKHSLITRTEAKNEYLLKDCDLDKREPPLKFINKKNPHNPRWGEMKLYLHVQIEKRALEVWGTEEKLLAEKELRNEKREESKAKKYAKQMKELRMQVRSSLYDKTSAGPHVHEFGPERYNEDDDNYSHDCECGYTETFEKL